MILSDPDPPDHYQMFVHIFGATDSPCCACFALIKPELDQQSYFPDEVTKTVIRNFYMDDLLSSHKTELEASMIIQQLIKLLKNRGFNLTKFNSNLPSVMQTVPIEKEAVQKQSTLDIEANSITRALGVKWNLKSDSFIFVSNTNREFSQATKRKILKKTATIFDPLGFLSMRIYDGSPLCRRTDIL